MAQSMTREEVQKLAALARLELTEHETDALAEDINSIISYVSEIQSVATEEPQPTAGIHCNIARDDHNPHESGLFTKALLKAAPSREKDFIQVKKIL